MAVTIDVDPLIPLPMDDQFALRPVVTVDTLGLAIIDLTQPAIDVPVVAGVSPAADTTLSPSTPLVFSFTHAGDSRVGVGFLAKFGSAQTPELVFDGTTFTPPYAGSSTFAPTRLAATKASTKPR